MYHLLPTSESLIRVEKLYNKLNEIDESWDTAIISDKVNSYYFAGSIGNALFILRKDGEYFYFVRNSFERANLESPLENIYEYNSYKDIAKVIGNDLGNLYIDKDKMSVITLERIQKYFYAEKINALDSAMASIKAVKTEYELDFMREAGIQHKKLFVEIVPRLLKEGMSEADLFGELYNEMMKLGHQGLSRYNDHQFEMPVGQVAFGDSSIFPSHFDSPDGMRGMSAFMYATGARDRKLERGDLVFIDIPYGYMGYHTDKTQIYCYKGIPDNRVLTLNNECAKIMDIGASMLKPGAIPEEIYENIIKEFSEDLRDEYFLGYESSQVKFLGHGVGIYVDEYPVIAKGFKEPLEENMTIALEPKVGINGVGMVGTEDTFLVTTEGGESLTGNSGEIIIV